MYNKLLLALIFSATTVVCVASQHDGVNTDDFNKNKASKKLLRFGSGSTFALDIKPKKAPPRGGGGGGGGTGGGAVPPPKGGATGPVYLGPLFPTHGGYTLQQEPAPRVGGRVRVNATGCTTAYFNVGHGSPSSGWVVGCGIRVNISQAKVAGSIVGSQAMVYP